MDFSLHGLVTAQRFVVVIRYLFLVDAWLGLSFDHTEIKHSFIHSFIHSINSQLDATLVRYDVNLPSSAVSDIQAETTIIIINTLFVYSAIIALCALCCTKEGLCEIFRIFVMDSTDIFPHILRAVFQKIEGVTCQHQPRTF